MKKLILISLIIFSIIALSNCDELEDKVSNGEIELTNDLAFTIFLRYKPQSDMNDPRFQIFKDNLNNIITHNKDPTKTWTMGINEFALLTDEEFAKQYLGNQDCSATAYATLQQKNKIQYDQDVPDHIDWRQYGVVTPVKDQRNCGSCWAFSTTGALESHWSLKWQIAPSQFSEQQLVDCAQAFNNNGCSGGLPSQAFEYIRYNGGIDFENSYPYQAKQSDTCQYSIWSIGATVPYGSVNITAFDELELTAAVGTKGPVSVAFQVTSDFKAYKSGVYNNPNCSKDPQQVNHAVLAVGYGVENDIPYWLIKNSWSSTWGDQGYFKMVRGSNMCGIADCASYPNLG